jgi:hypothetical protein
MINSQKIPYWRLAVEVWKIEWMRAIPPSTRHARRPNLREAIEGVAVIVACNDALDDRTDGVPRDAHHRAERGLVTALGEVSDVVLERSREPRAWVGPRQPLHLDTARRTLDASRVIAEVKLHPSHLEMPPATVVSAIVARADLSTLRATRATPGRCHVDDQTSLVEPNINDTGLFQPQQDTE